MKHEIRRVGYLKLSFSLSKTSDCIEMVLKLYRSGLNILGAKSSVEIGQDMFQRKFRSSLSDHRRWNTFEFYIPVFANLGTFLPNLNMGPCPESPWIWNQSSNKLNEKNTL